MVHHGNTCKDSFFFGGGRVVVSFTIPLINTNILQGKKKRATVES